MRHSCFRYRKDSTMWWTTRQTVDCPPHGATREESQWRRRGSGRHRCRGRHGKKGRGRGCGDRDRGAGGATAGEENQEEGDQSVVELVVSTYVSSDRRSISGDSRSVRVKRDSHRTMRAPDGKSNERQRSVAHSTV